MINCHFLCATFCNENVALEKCLFLFYLVGGLRSENGQQADIATMPSCGLTFGLVRKSQIHPGILVEEKGRGLGFRIIHDNRKRKLAFFQEVVIS